MFASLRSSLARLSRWPRHVAALGCLVFAAAGAVSPAHGTPSPRTRATADLLRPGEVAVSIPVTSAPADLRRGDLVGLLVGPDESGAGAAAMLADRLRVLAPPVADASGSDPPKVLVAAARDAALRIAAGFGRSVLVVVDKSP